MNRKSFAGLLLLASVVCSAPAAAQEQPVPSADEIKAMIRQGMDEALAKMLAPGPVEPGWNKGGVDLRAVAAARPGGLAGNYLLTVDKDGEPSVSIFSSDAVAKFLPADWQRLSRIGDIDAAPAGSTLEFGNMDGPYYFVARIASTRVGDALCSGAPAGADLYRAPGPEGEEVMPPEVVEFMFEAVIDMLSKQVICERADAAEPGYRLRYFYEDGRSIPAMDSQNDRIRIVPAAPIAELLKKAP